MPVIALDIVYVGRKIYVKVIKTVAYLCSNGE